LSREKALGDVVSTAAARGHITTAHDLSDGGLAQALVESCLRHGLGARIVLPEGVTPFVAMFAESTARMLVAIPRGHDKAFTALCDEHGVPWTALGVVDRGGALEIRNQFTVPLDELREAWTATLPKHFGGAAAEAAAQTNHPVTDEQAESSDQADSLDQTGDAGAQAEMESTDQAAVAGDEPAEPPADQ
jgi:phosphoribosylformylglycinamidine synthase